MVRWTPEMEEEFIDLEIMEDILEEKRTVKGDFTTGIYIKEQKEEFEKVSVLDGEIELYLPQKREKKEHYGREFMYPKVMGKFEEYVSDDGRFCFTIEKLEDCLPEDSDIKADVVENIEDRYANTVITEIADFENKGMKIDSIMAEGMIGEDFDEYVGFIFFIVCGTELYRFYIMSEDSLWDITYKLGLRVVKNMELKEGIL